MKKARVVQRHHMVYPSPEHPEQELVVPIYKGEHEIATKMSMYLRKSTSKGFCKWLKFWLLINEDRAIDLNADN